MRNVEKQATKGHKIVNNRTDLTLDELKQLFDILRNHKNPEREWDALSAAFYFGVAVGSRQMKQ